MNLRSFDAPRRRPAPAQYRSDEGLNHPIAPRTVFIFIKSQCDGCAAFQAGFQAAGWDAKVVAMDTDVIESLSVIRARELVQALDVRHAPFFVAVDGDPLVVVTEGVPFDPEHLRSLLSAVS
ncbi:MAG: hypothetical protein KJS64_04760 [Acidobacteria bacterium]|nr:hypothetical protein [Acidobacteriota bacterium]